MRLRADLGVLLLLAIAVRAAFVADLSGQVAFRSPLVDARTYDDQARAVAEHGPAAIPLPYYQPPMYPMLLGGLYALTGGSWMAPRVANAALGVLTILLAASLAARGGRRRAGWLAGGLLAVYGPILYFEGELLPPALLLALWAGAVRLLLDAEDSPRPLPRLLGAGLLLGVSAATRPTSFLYAAVAALWWARGRRRAGRVREVAALAAAVALPVLPFAAANRIGGGEPVLVSFNGGINFYLGNGSNPDSLVAIQPGYAWDKLQIAPFADGVRGSRRAESAYWVERALREAAADPAAWARAFGRKVLLLLDARETPRNTDYEDFRRDSAVLSLPLPGFGLVAPLALLGALLAFAPRGPSPPRLRSLLGFTLAAVAAQNLLFFVADRYRLEAVPALCVLAGLGLDEAWRRRGRIGWGPALGVVAAAVVANAGLPGPRPVDEARAAIHRAVALQALDLNESAMRKLRDALRHDPGDVDAHRLLAQQYVKRRDPARALAEFDLALAGAPDYVEALVSKAQVLEILGRGPEAEAAYRRALAADPFSTRVRLLYGVFLAKAGRRDEAREQFEAGRRIDPTNPDFVANLGNLDRLSGGS